MRDGGSFSRLTRPLMSTAMMVAKPEGRTIITESLCHALMLVSVSGKHVHVSPESPLFAWYIVIIIVLVLLGGIYSGLTLGLMGLDTVRLLRLECRAPLIMMT